MGALLSSMAVQGFSLAELALGVKTATMYGGLFGGRTDPTPAVRAVRVKAPGPMGGGGRESPGVGKVIGGLVGDGGGVGGRRFKP